MDSKQCTKCNATKPIESFAWKNKAKGKKASCCKECHKVLRDKHYRDNREKSIANSKKNREATRKKLWEYLQDKSCVDCGYDNPIALEFDHIDPEAKVASVSVLTGYSWAKVLEEISKCEIRCANCHRIKTAKQFGWYQYN